MEQNYVWWLRKRSGLEHLIVAPYDLGGLTAEGLVIERRDTSYVHFRYVAQMGIDFQVRELRVLYSLDPSSQPIHVMQDGVNRYLVNRSLRDDLSRAVAIDVPDAASTKAGLITRLALKEGDERDVIVASIDVQEGVVKPVHQNWRRYATASPEVSHYVCLQDGHVEEYLVNSKSIIMQSLRRWRLRCGDQLIHDAGKYWPK